MDRFFRFISFFQNALMRFTAFQIYHIEKHGNERILAGFQLGFVIFFMILFVNIPNDITASLFSGFILFAPLLSNVSKIFISVRGFICIGLPILLYVCLALMGLLSQLLDYSLNLKIGISYLIIFLVILLIQLFYCLIANNKVAKLINACLAAILAIINLALKCVPYIPKVKLVLNTSPNTTITGVEYTAEEIFNITVNLYTAPLLLLSIILTLICEIKGYWFQKYKYVDISEEGIQKIYNLTYID